MTKGQDTRTKLLQTAIELIWRESFGSVSVDDICAHAGVLKGSFYHFFPSKVDLAVEAVKSSWLEYQPELERIYAADIAPLERLRRHCDMALEKQSSFQKEFGFVPGCPFTALGSEQGTQNESLRSVIDSHMRILMNYFTKAIKDAVEAGDIPKTNIRRKTAEIFSLYLGAFTCARIMNDLQPIKTMKDAFMSLLGAYAETTVK